MSKLDKDVLFLILKELQDDKRSLYSCLLVNRTWCKITVPMLWKNPGEFFPIYNAKNSLFYYNTKNSLFNVVLSHLSEESRDILRDHGINIMDTYQRPLFDYISFWRHLNLLDSIDDKGIFEEHNMIIITILILKLFINSDTRFTHLHISKQLDYVLNHISWAENCFSELECFQCDSEHVDPNIFEELSRVSKSIKKLELNNLHINNGIIKLIEAQKNLKDVGFVTSAREKSACKALEESLMKNADTIQCLKMDWIPMMKTLSHLVNLINLDMSWDLKDCSNENDWDLLENVSLPFIKVLKARQVPSKILSSLIENTKGQLVEINIFNWYFEDLYSGRIIIQSIYKNCPNLQYLKLLFNKDNFLELEKLLVNCQNLIGIFIFSEMFRESDWIEFFKILAQSSPNSLNILEFSTIDSCKLETLAMFFDNWNGRQPMSLSTLRPVCTNLELEKYSEVFEEYKSKGVVKDYYYFDF